MTNSLEPNDLSHLTDEEFYALCPQGEHAPGPEPLSPAAQSVLDAAHAASSWGPDDCLNDAREIAAASLRAVADEIDAPLSITHVPEQQQRWYGLGVANFRRKLLATAAELEGQQSTSSTH